MTTANIEIFRQQFPDGMYGYGLRLLSEQATLGDYVQALNDWQEQNMAACRGCDACCYERIPLTIADFAIARPLIADLCGKPESEVSLMDWLERCAEINRNADGAIDVILKRTEDGACCFLDQELAECREHLFRSLVCQTHCCLPKSLLALEFRAAVINAGEDELCRRLLQSPERPAALADCRAEDYPATGFAAVSPENWQNLKISAIVSDEIWQRLQKTRPKHTSPCE